MYTLLKYIRTSLIEIHLLHCEGCVDLLRLGAVLVNKLIVPSYVYSASCQQMWLELGACAAAVDRGFEVCYKFYSTCSKVDQYT